MVANKFRDSFALASLAVLAFGTACSAREYVERVYSEPYYYYPAPPYQETYIYRDRESGAEKAGKGVAGLGDRSAKVGVGIAGKAAKSVLQAF